MVRMSDLARGGPVVPPPRTPATPPAEPEVAVRLAAVPQRPASYGEPLDPPPLAPTPPPPGAPTLAAEPAEPLFEELRTFLERVPEFLQRGDSPSWITLQRLVERVLRSLETGGELFWLSTGVFAADGRDYVALHHARVTVLALRIGLTAGYERERLIELGAAAALGGIGLWLLPAGLLRRLDGLSRDEGALYHTHPKVASDRLRRWGGPFEKLASTVLQYEEREHGQGFPQGLQGSAIRMEAKIVGLADTYVALTAPPSLQPGLRPYEAVREIVRSKHEAFPSVLVKALLNDVTVFPPGTMVRLNSGEIGSVVAVNRNHPLRPRVQIVAGKTGPLATRKITDLSEAPFLYITGPVTETAR
jgi:HD-GYP domain-containing protein (c-di-GMP phosphodiesterase class II)